MSRSLPRPGLVGIDVRPRSSVADGVAVVCAGRVLCANEAMGSLVGVSVSKLTGRRALDFLRPTDRPLAEALVRQLNQGGTDCVRDYQLLKSDGTQLSVEIRSSAVVLDERRAILLIVRDLTRFDIKEDDIRRFAASQLLKREEERRLIAHEIHDVLGQSLTALKFDLAALRRRASGQSGEMPALGVRGVSDRSSIERIDLMMTRLDETLAAARGLATDLRPSALDDLGLEAALEHEVAGFCRRTRLACDCEVTLSEEALATKEATALFRILQEALTNVARHAKASRVVVKLGEVRGRLQLTIEDDGRGFVVDSIRSDQSLGLLGLRERARSCGGDVTIVTSPGAGTTVEARIPVTPPRRTSADR